MGRLAAGDVEFRHRSRRAARGLSRFRSYLLEGELAFRHEKTVRLNLQFARLPYQKKLEDFDFSQQPSLDRRLIDELATLCFLADGRNVVLLGPPGVGKTHLAIAIGKPPRPATAFTSPPPLTWLEGWPSAWPKTA